MPVTEKRVSRLERALEDFVTNVGIEFNKLYNFKNTKGFKPKEW